MAIRSAGASIVRLPANLTKFVRESYEELKKVAWPSRKLTIRYTIIVIIASLLAGLVMGGIDYLLTLGLEYIVL